MIKKPFSIFDLLAITGSKAADLELKCLYGCFGLERLIEESETNRPGLALCGFFESFGENRIQILGKGESAYLRATQDEKALKEFLSRRIVCCIFTHGEPPTDLFARIAEETNTPVLQTTLGSTEFQSRLFMVLIKVFAPKEHIHGVLVEVSGVGVLLLGQSGVGKSETALELIERGHRLVADDVVEVKRLGDKLVGSASSEINKRYMEIRGLGIIDISRLFGVQAVRDNKQIDLVVQLEEWRVDKYYDRIGTEELTYDLLGLKTPKLVIPVKPGRNIPIIVETAALNERWKTGSYAKSETLRLDNEFAGERKTFL